MVFVSFYKPMIELLETSSALLDAVNNYLPVETLIEVNGHLAPELAAMARAIELTEECQCAVESVSGQLA
jgi:hypothetical protein